MWKASHVFGVEQFEILCWKAYGKPNLLMVSKLKWDPSSPSTCQICLNIQNREEKLGVCIVHCTVWLYIVPPIPYDLLYFMWPCSTGAKNWFFPSNYSRAKKFYKAAWNKISKRAAWVRVKKFIGLCIILCITLINWEGELMLYSRTKGVKQKYICISI